MFAVIPTSDITDEKTIPLAELDKMHDIIRDYDYSDITVILENSRSSSL